LEDLSNFFCTHLGYIPTTATNPSTKTKTKLSFNRYVCLSHIPVGEAWKKKTLGSFEELGENIYTYYIHTYISSTYTHCMGFLINGSLPGN
jgi:hypothetical protein